MKLICPNNPNHTTFHALGIPEERAELDSIGEYIETSEFIDDTENPDDYYCDVCGAKAIVEDDKR